jgi:hypothetical protein
MVNSFSFYNANARYCCFLFLFSVGKLSKVGSDGGNADTNPVSDVKLGEELPNCGVKDPCTGNNFPVHLFSGFQNKEGPKICVSGK